MTSIRLAGMTIDSEGEGPPIVMLHGLGGTSNSFQAMVPPLAGYLLPVLKMNTPVPVTLALPETEKPPPSTM